VTIVVVGAGILGLMTAHRCAEQGWSVIVLERGSIPHRASSSFDEHRILRRLHPGQPGRMRLAARAEQAWLELDRDLGGGLYHRCGALMVGPSAVLGADVSDQLREGNGFTWTTGALLRQRFVRLKLPPTTSGYFDACAGVLLAHATLEALKRRLESLPRVCLRAHCEVVRVDVDRARVELGDGEIIRGDALVLCAGVWSAALTGPRADMTIMRQSLIYLEPPTAIGAELSAWPAMPRLGTRDGDWLIPPVSGTHLKMTAARTCRPVGQVEAQARTPMPIQRYLAGRFTHLIHGADPAWIAGFAECHYLEPQGGARLKPRWVGAASLQCSGCGGAAFKFAPVIAEHLVRQLSRRIMRRRAEGKTLVDDPPTRVHGGASAWVGAVPSARHTHDTGMTRHRDTAKEPK
jgi:sarcosine oxidase